jgi:hypothetical protein
VVGKRRPRKLDFAWTDGDQNVVVGIEHHSWYSDGKGYSDRVLTILMSNAPLGVLITYVPNRASSVNEQIRSVVQAMLVEDSEHPQEFVIVLADTSVTSPTPWWGYVWDASTSALRESPST